MPFGRFLALSAVGVTAWTTVLAVAGYLLRQAYSDVGRYLDPVATVVMAALVLWYAVRVVRFDPGDDVADR